MRHPHGLRSAAAGLPAIGSAMEGGFFAGGLSISEGDSIATHLLIVAPAATGATGTGYTLTTLKSYGPASDDPGTGEVSDGAINSAAINDVSHPAARFCETLSIDGYTDWYLPARYELQIAYQNLKPTTTSNNTSRGDNPYSVPARNNNYTAGNPAQTSAAAFQSGGAEAFMADYHWSSTQGDAPGSLGGIEDGIFQNFSNGQIIANTKTFELHVRAFRKVAV